MKHLGHDVGVGPSLGRRQLCRRPPRQRLERGGIDLLADTGVFNERVVDIPEHEARHPVTLLAVKTSLHVLARTRYVPLNTGHERATTDRYAERGLYAIEAG